MTKLNVIIGHSYTENYITASTRGRQYPWLVRSMLLSFRVVA